MAARASSPAAGGLPLAVVADARDAPVLAAHELRAAAVPSPGLDALLLLAAALQTTKAAILAHPERQLGEEERARFGALIGRRAERVPLAYLLGEREFYGRDFAVSPDELVP